MTDKCEFIMVVITISLVYCITQLCHLTKPTTKKSCGFKYKNLNKSWLPAAHCYLWYVFHLPLSAKPVSTSFGSSEGWKLHFKLLDNNFFFLGGGGDAHTTHRGNRPYMNSGLLLTPLAATYGKSYWNLRDTYRWQK